MRWFRVDEKLPDFGVPVWATDQWPHIYLSQIEVRGNGEKYWSVHGGDEFYPDFWTPIPKEPK